LFVICLICATKPTIAQTSASNWLADLHVEEYAGGTLQASRLLIFGVAPEGSDGIDEHLGESELPPDPPGGLHAAFIGEGLGNGLSKDIRSDEETSLTFSVKLLRDNAGEILLSWDPAWLSSQVSAASLEDAAGGAVLVVDMLATGNAEIPALVNEVRILVNLQTYDPQPDPDAPEFYLPGGGGYDP